MLLKALCIIHFVAIGEFKLDYSPETPNLGKNQWFFFSRVTLQFDYDLEKK